MLPAACLSSVFGPVCSGNWCPLHLWELVTLSGLCLFPLTFWTPPPPPPAAPTLPLFTLKQSLSLLTLKSSGFVANSCLWIGFPVKYKTTFSDWMLDIFLNFFLLLNACLFWSGGAKHPSVRFLCQPWWCRELQTWSLHCHIALPRPWAWGHWCWLFCLSKYF